MKELLSRIAQASATNTEGSTFDLAAYERRKADRYNRSRGNLTGIDCGNCLNRGDFMMIHEDEQGGVSEVYEPCECMAARKSMDRLRNSGLEEGIKRCRLDNYRTDEEWQRRMLSAAEAYIEETDGAWFFVGGAVGAGKTHICTAICGEYLMRMPVMYAIWPEELQRLKATQFDDAEYSPRMRNLMNIDLLFLDDFFKVTAGKEPSAADIRIAHELLNHRYVARKQTIISSERYLSEIIDIDQATGGRIAERAKGYTLNLQRAKAKDYRMRLAGDLI